jgi:hypothetical protein
VSEEVLAEADACAVVPMVGMVESLNVSVAAALMLHEARRGRLAALVRAGALTRVHTHNTCVIDPALRSNNCGHHGGAQHVGAAPGERSACSMLGGLWLLLSLGSILAEAAACD